MDKNKPLVSILIANYNNGHYIEEAIKSVTQQTYPHWEIIIVDDASTDNSWSVIQRLAEIYPNIHSHRNQINLKVGETKARAANLANGSICAILDPDDALEPMAMERHVAVYLNHPNCSMVGSNYYECDEQLKIKNVKTKIYVPNQYNSYLASEGGIHHFWSFSKEKYNLTKGFDSRYILAEDQDLFYKLEEVGDIHIIDEPLYYYRSHQNAISQGDKIALAYAYHLLAMFDALKRRPKNKEVLIVVRGNSEHFMSWGITKIKNPLRLQLLTKIFLNFPEFLFNRTLLTTLLGIVKTS